MLQPIKSFEKSIGLGKVASSRILKESVASTTHEFVVER